MGKKSPPPSPPDLTPISEAQLELGRMAQEQAAAQLGLSREQFEWFKGMAAEELELAREQAQRAWDQQDRAFDSDQQLRDIAEQVGQSQLEAMQQAIDFAGRDRERYEEVFLPMQDRFIEEANAYDTPERREAEAARQMADVGRAAEQQRAAADARLRGMGIDPSQVRATSMTAQLGAQTAAQQAAAGNQGRTMIEERGRALRADAMNLGMGLPSQVAQGYAMSQGAGAGAINAGQAGQQGALGAISGGIGVGQAGLGMRSGAINNAAGWTGTPLQWAQSGVGALGVAGNQFNNAGATLTQGFNNQMNSWNAGQQQSQGMWNNVMGLGGMAAGLFMAEGGEAKTTTKKSAISTESPAKKTAKLSTAERLDRALSMAEQWKGSGAETGGTEMIPSALKYQYYAEGHRGALPVRQVRDKIPALLTEGEYIIPADVVRSVGIEKLDKMVAKYHREGA